MTPSDPPTAPADPPPRKIRSLPPRVARSELTREVLAESLLSDAALLQHSIRQGAHWFYWVAALSLINSVIALFGGHVTFLAGLALSQIADGIAAHLGFVGPYFAIGIDLVVAFFVCGFGYMASEGSRTALVVGMILYGLDALVFVFFGIYMPALFHAFVLYQMARGWMARAKLDRLRTESPILAEAERVVRP